MRPSDGPLDPFRSATLGAGGRAGPDRTVCTPAAHGADARRMMERVPGRTGPAATRREENHVAADDLVVRTAEAGDVAQVCAFGEAHIRPHYTPLIGAEAADEQVARWWRPEQILPAAVQGRIVVATAADRVVGVAQHGRDGEDAVLYKLYVDPRRRGHGLGPRLVAAVEDSLPPDVRRLCVEHFAGNVRAAAFYEREGFAVERVEPSATGSRALDVVWRARPITTGAGTP